jgi:SAM-dependent methyltransferase
LERASGAPVASQFSDPHHLAEHAYKTGAQFDSRVELHRRFSTYPGGWYPWLLEHIRLPARGLALEVGCGPAFMWRGHTQQVPPGLHLLLSDLSLGMVREAQANTAGAPNVSVLTSSASPLPLPPGSLNVIIANHMLYHVPDLHTTLAGFARSLKPGGVLYASTNGSEHMKEMWDWVDEALPDWDAADTFRTGILSFCTQNGAAILGKHFSQVDYVEIPDSLAITETQPILYYLATVSMAHPLTPAQQAKLKANLDEKVAASGVLNVRKQTGLFIATQPLP